jgi:SAM-dependent methyltransferase
MPDLKSFDSVAHLYDETRGIPAEVERDIADGILTLLRSVARAPHLLEVGIGTGRIAVPLADRGVRVTGIDISAKMLAILRDKRPDIDVMFAEASRPPLRDASFDGSLFVHILHLVPNPEATIRATMAAVRPGGVMIEAGDDKDASVVAQAHEAIDATVKDLSGVELPGWKPHEHATALFHQAATSAGARVETRTLARWKGSTTGQRFLERLKRRDYSGSWKIPDGIMPQLLERLTPRVAELFGGLDKVVENERSFSMRYARLPE